MMVKSPTVMSPSSGRANLPVTTPAAAVDEQSNFVSQALSLTISPLCAGSESERESKMPSVEPRPTSMAIRDRGVRMEQETSNYNTSHALSNINCSLSVAHLKDINCTLSVSTASSTKVKDMDLGRAGRARKLSSLAESRPMSMAVCDDFYIDGRVRCGSKRTCAIMEARRVSKQDRSVRMEQEIRNHYTRHGLPNISCSPSVDICEQKKQKKAASPFSTPQ